MVFDLHIGIDYSGKVELETTAKMTDRQIAAKVALHFATKPVKKSGTPKKALTKKAAKATSEKRTK